MSDGSVVTTVDVNIGERYVKSNMIIVVISRGGSGRVGGRVVWSSCDVDYERGLIGKMTDEIVVKMRQQTTDKQFPRSVITNTALPVQNYKQPGY